MPENAIRQKVSLSLIVRNEEHNLAECLRPLCGLVDEIVVVDTGSTDRTKDIAQSFGARVVDFPWCDDFSAARNESLRNCTGNWVLWMDADDRLDDKNVIRLRAIINELSEKPHAYVMQVVSPADHSTESASVVSHIRLFPNHPEVRWRGRVHEQILLDIMENVDCAVIFSEVVIQHVGYVDPVLQRRKANRDLRLLRMEYAANPNDAVVLFHLGLCQLRLGQADTALTYLLLSLKHAPPESADWLRRLYSTAADTLRKLSRFSESLSLSEQGLARFPGDPELVYLRADLLTDLGQIGGAERLLTEFLSSSPGTFLYHGANDVLNRRAPRRLLGYIYRVQGRFAAAERILQELLSEVPSDIASWVHLGYVYLAQKRFRDVQFTAQQLEKCDRGQAYADVMRAEIGIANGDWQMARQLLDRAILSAPRLVWAKVILGDLLQATNPGGDLHFSLQRDILRLDPGNISAQQALQRNGDKPVVSIDSLGWSICVGNI